MKIATRSIIQTFSIFLCFLWTTCVLIHQELWYSSHFTSGKQDKVSAPLALYPVSAYNSRNSTTKQVLTKHRPRRRHEEKKFITYELIQNDEEYNYTFDPMKLRCKREVRRAPLPIPSEVGVTDFRTRVKTNLNILYMGDSVGTQFVQSFQDAAGAKHTQTIRYAWGLHKLSHIARVEGGGKVAGLRVTGFFLEEWMNVIWRVAPSPGGGWLENDVRELKRLVHQWRKIVPLKNAVDFHQQNYQGEEDYYTYTESDSMDKNTDVVEDVHDQKLSPTSSVSSSDSNSTCSCCQHDEKNFDVVVHQFPAAWIYESAFKRLLHESMSEEAINRSITDTLKFFCPKTIIVQTVPLMNNIFSAEEYVETNRNIFNVVKKFRETKSNVTMLIMDLATLSTSFVLRNALSIGALTSIVEVQSHVTASSGTNDTASLRTTTNMTHFQELLSYYASHEEETTIYSLANSSSGSSSRIEENGKETHPLVQVLELLVQQRLKKKRKKQYWRTIISHGCGKFVTPNTTTTCPVQNQFSTDGQHWCMDVIGSRIDGGLACLLQCSLDATVVDYSHDDASSLLQEQATAGTSTSSIMTTNITTTIPRTTRHSTTHHGISALESCERKCNSLFMNLSPISFQNGMYKSYSSNM